ncbi:HesB/YadR/YfhF family protein [Bacillus toyonensis]|uniref:Cytoplasmic protein n=1 Tax=Bacillus toyonensis TaxID=155322 RepID=A0A2B5Y6U4_9BACI|nr:iron-sulfur cluster biosynthesis family protein [Bacillus toyonensis]PGB04150.1 cytoplasmic protein [Bacillus toyonensis]PHD67660.1 cytoplasmic protein [Bacillus toyonensis]
MNIIVENEAVKWFKEELRINRNECIRFGVRYGGNSSIQPGYSLGIVSEKPDGEIVSVEKEGIIFFVDFDDLWYFQNYDLVVSYHKETEEIQFNYVK